MKPTRRKWATRALRIFSGAILMLLVFAPLAHADTLTLRDAIDRALRFAPSVAMAAASSDLSEAQTRETRAPMYPSLSAASEYSQFARV